MAEPAALTDPPITETKRQSQPKPPILWTANYRKDTRTSIRQDAFQLERLIMSMAAHPMIDPASLASLVRSWCQLVDTIRVIQGKPLPGQLRPDLDPAQAMKALKRIRERLPVDIAGHKASIADAPGQVSVPAKSKRGRPPKPLQTLGLTTSPETPLDNPPLKSAVDESTLDLPDDDTAID